MVVIRGESRYWRYLSLILAFVCLILTICFIVGALWVRSVLVEMDQKQTFHEEIGCLPHPAIPNQKTLIEGPSTLFSDLSALEMDNIVNFLHKQEFLDLAPHAIAETNSNYIHMIEMLTPPKAQVLKYLDESGPEPERMARAFIFRGNTSNPIIEEYIVGPLPNPTRVSLMQTDARKTQIGFNMRPFSKYEFKAVHKHILPAVLKKAEYILKESYDANMTNCHDKCLRFTTTPISSGFLDAGKRKGWFWFTYDLEFYTLHPLDFQFLVDTTDSDPGKWKVERVFYANSLYENLDDLVEKYNKASINKTHISFPSIPDEKRYSAIYIRGDPVPKKSHPAPEQVQPLGPRYEINGNVLEYMDWRFDIRVSPSVGTQLYNIQYRGERIVYELSLQEIAVLYSGHSPAASMLYFADSAGLFGTRMRGMMPGMDCPDHGTMFDTLSYTSHSKGKLMSQNSLCIFEHDTGTLLRRHRAYGMSGAFYSGLKDHVLVVRMYICIINYDYIIDFIFHNNGAIEVKVSSTGYLATSFYYPTEEPYGTRITHNVIAGLHHHFFNFKADVDVKGISNRVHTLNIGTKNKKDIWADNPNREHVQNFISVEEKRTEKEASVPFNFDKPKYTLIYSNEASDLGLKPSYRIIHKGLTKPLLPEGTGFEPSVSWIRQQLAVTKHKDDELTSSSMFAMWDAQDPVVNFAKYLEDDESIVDEVRQLLVACIRR